MAPETGGKTLDTDKSLRPARGESLVRATLALALAAAVVWALAGENGAFQALRFGFLAG